MKAENNKQLPKIGGKMEKLKTKVWLVKIEIPRELTKKSMVVKTEKVEWVIKLLMN